VNTELREKKKRTDKLVYTLKIGTSCNTQQKQGESRQNHEEGRDGELRGGGDKSMEREYGTEKGRRQEHGKGIDNEYKVR